MHTIYAQHCAGCGREIAERYKSCVMLLENQNLVEGKTTKTQKGQGQESTHRGEKSEVHFVNIMNIKGETCVGGWNQTKIRKGDWI